MPASVLVRLVQMCALIVHFPNYAKRLTNTDTHVYVSVGGQRGEVISVCMQGNEIKRSKRVCVYLCVQKFLVPHFVARWLWQC